MTPFWMKVLAGQFVPVNFFEMMFSIINMIIVPIVAGLVANRILYPRSCLPTGRRGGHRTFQRGATLALIGAASILLAAGVGLFAPSGILAYGGGVLRKDGFIVGLLLIGVVALTKLAIGVWANRNGNWIDKTLPIVSMAGICFIIAIITARSRDDLMTVGPILIGAAMIHNAVGYLLGYWLARAVRLDQIRSRTVAIEVGMQNGGMASALAMNVLKSPQAALAPAIFGPWMNVSASILATWWRRKPVKVSTPPAKKKNTEA